MAPIVFIVAYYLTYDKIPTFPPVGAANKIFYIVLAATLAGLLCDLLASLGFAERGRSPDDRVTGTASLLVAIWIGLPRFSATDVGLVLTIAALVLGGTLVLWRLATIDAAEIVPVNGAVLLAVLPGVFAPIALFGGSSTSVGLCLGLTAGLAMMALVNLFSAPRPGADRGAGRGRRIARGHRYNHFDHQAHRFPGPGCVSGGPVHRPDRRSRCVAAARQDRAFARLRSA